MSDNFKGMGAIPGIAIGRIKLVGQDLTKYLAAYKPGDKAEELEKLNKAIEMSAEILEKNVEAMRAKGQDDQADIMEAHSMLVQDPMLTDGMVEKTEELGNAAEAVIASSQESAAIFAEMDDDYLRERAADVLDVGKRIAKVILGIKEPELGDEKLIVEQHQGIYACTQEEIILRTQCGLMAISGENLSLSRYDRDGLVVLGKIRKLSYRPKG